MVDQVVERIPNPRAVEWNALRRNWGWMLALGFVWIVLGALAIVVPFAATLAIELPLGAIFVVGGFAQIAQAFGSRGWGGFALHLLSGLLAFGLGLALLVFPMQGILAVTMVLAAFLLADGVVRSVAALRHREWKGWGLMLLSGALSIAIGVLIAIGWPSSASWAIGLLIGIDLLFGGAALAALALTARSATEDAA